GAASWLPEAQRQSACPACGGQLFAQGTVAGDAARSSHTSEAQALRRPHGFGHQHLQDGRLHAGTEVAQTPAVIENFRMIPQKVAHGSLQSAEAQIVIRLVEHRPGEIKSARVPALGQYFQRRPAWIRHADELRYFVETFACGVIDSRAKVSLLQLR